MVVRVNSAGPANGMQTEKVWESLTSVEQCSQNYFWPTDHFTKTWQLAGHFS